VGELLEKFPHAPSKLLHKGSTKIIPSSQTDSRRERKVRFGYRELPGTTETLVAKKVVWRQLLKKHRILLTIPARCGIIILLNKIKWRKCRKRRQYYGIRIAIIQC
jgi:hypothetical protein